MWGFKLCRWCLVTDFLSITKLHILCSTVGIKWVFLSIKMFLLAVIYDGSSRRKEWKL